MYMYNNLIYCLKPCIYSRNKKNKLSVVSAFPGLSIEISFDDQLTWTTVSSATTAYKGQTIHLRTRSVA